MQDLRVLFSDALDLFISRRYEIESRRNVDGASMQKRDKL